MSFSSKDAVKGKEKPKPKTYIKFWKPVTKGGEMRPAVPEGHRRYNSQFLILDLETPGFTQNRIADYLGEGFKPLEVQIGKYDQKDPRVQTFAGVAKLLEAPIKLAKEEHKKSLKDWEKNEKILDQADQEKAESQALTNTQLEAAVKAAKVKGESDSTLAEEAGVEK